MYVLGRYFSTLCVLGIGFGLSACSAAGDAGGASASEGSPAGQSGLSLNPDLSNDRDGAGGGTTKPGTSDMIPDDDDGDVTPPGGSNGGSGGGGSCACTCGHNPLPGVSIDTIDGVVQVVIDVAGTANVAADVTLHLSGANAGCKPTDHGIELTGNVDVDLGIGDATPLLGADLTVSVGTNPGAISINGTAMVGTSSLPALDLPDVDLKADVALDLGKAAGPQLDVTLHPTTLGLNLGRMPMAGDPLQLVDATVKVSTSSNENNIQVQGTLGSDAANPWNSTVPLSTVGAANVTAWLTDESVTKLNLSGDLELNGGSLISGLVPLAVVKLDDAAMTWSQDGIAVDAHVNGKLHPLISVAANADLHLALSKEAWEIKLCAGAALSLGGDALDALQCLDLTDGGVAVCEE